MAPHGTARSSGCGIGAAAAGDARRRSAGLPAPAVPAAATGRRSNGTWDFAIDHERRLRRPSEVQLGSHDRRAVRAGDAGAAASATPGCSRPCWYRRTFERPELARRTSGCSCTSARSTTTRRSGSTARSRCEHEGGYTPFSADITDLLATRPGRARDRRARRRRPGRSREAARQAGLAARAALDLVPAHHRIWQTVWLERVPRDAHRRRCGGPPNLERWEIGARRCVVGSRTRAQAAAGRQAPRRTT